MLIKVLTILSFILLILGLFVYPETEWYQNIYVTQGRDAATEEYICLNATFIFCVLMFGTIWIAFPKNPIKEK